MAIETRVASRYAKSLLELAIEKGQLEAVHNDMQMFLNICKTNKEFDLMLKKPIIDHMRKLSIIEKIFKGKVSDLTFTFLRTVTLKKREAVLAPISEEFHKRYLDYKGIITASITTAIPLTDDLRKKFTDHIKALTGKQVELTEIVNKDIIGGYILKVGDRQIDDSIKMKLKELRLALA